MLDWGLEESLGNHRFCGWSRNQRFDLSGAIKDLNFVRIFRQDEIFSETWALPITVLFAMVAYAVVAAIFYNNDGWNLYRHKSYCSMFYEIYIVINLIVLCNYCKNQIIVRNLNDGLRVKAIYWDCTSMYFNLQWSSSVLLLYEIC